MSDEAAEDQTNKDWCMMDDHAYISTVEDEDAPMEETPNAADDTATTTEDSDYEKPSTPTPERIEDIILGRKIPKELKSILELSKEAKIDVNMMHKRKSVTESDSSAERSETPDRQAKKRVSMKMTAAEMEALLEEQDGGGGSKMAVDSPTVREGKGVVLKRRLELTTPELRVKRMPMPARNSANVRNHKDSFCWQCHRNGVNVSCETCPRSYHTKCVKATVLDVDHWPCPECIAILTAENVKTRSVAMKDVSLEQLCDLLKFAHRRMVQVADTDPFMHPVNEADFPEYYSYIVQPMDLTTLQKNIKENTYGSTIAFEADAKWILHNSIIFNTLYKTVDQSKLTSTAKTIVRICKHEMSEIENCYTCYLNANTKKNWFVEVCPKPHAIIWAKLKGFPYWPAKAMCTNTIGMVDCRFFGAHDRAWVSFKDCYLYCQQDPNSNKQKRLDIIACIKEVDIYIANLCKIYEDFKCAPFKTLYDPENELKQLQLLLPKYNSDDTSAQTSKIVPKLKIVAKKTSEFEPTTFKVKDTKAQPKQPDEKSSDSEAEIDDESEETSEEDEEDEEVTSSEEDISNKRTAIIDEDSEFSESEEIKVIQRIRTRRRGTRRTSELSERSNDTRASSVQSGKNSDTESIAENTDTTDITQKSPDKDSNISKLPTCKISDVLMKKLKESDNNDVSDKEECNETNVEDKVDDDKVEQESSDLLFDDKKLDEHEISFESSEQEDDKSDKEVPHVTGDMEEDDEDDSKDEEDKPEDSSKEPSNIDKEKEKEKNVVEDENKMETENPEPETKSSETEENETNKQLVGTTKEKSPVKEPSENSSFTVSNTTETTPAEANKKSDETKTTNTIEIHKDKDKDRDKEKGDNAESSVSLLKDSENVAKNNTETANVPEITKLVNLVESTGTKRKKSTDSSSTDSDAAQRSKRPMLDEKQKESNSKSNGYESIQSILQRQNKPKPPIQNNNKTTTTSQTPTTTTTTTITNQTEKPLPKPIKHIPKPASELPPDANSSTVEVKSEPASPDDNDDSGNSSSDGEPDEECFDNGYMEAKLQYLSALNISEKRPLDKNKEKKQKEIRTRSKTEELTKGSGNKGPGGGGDVLRNIASYLENAGDEISIHKKRHSTTTATSDSHHPTANAMKTLQHNSSVTIKQRARKSFPKPMASHPAIMPKAAGPAASGQHHQQQQHSLIKPGVAKHHHHHHQMPHSVVTVGNKVVGVNEGKRSFSVLNSAGIGSTSGVITTSLANSTATTTTTNMMILTHPQTGSVVLPAGSTLPQGLTPYLSNYYYVTQAQPHATPLANSGLVAGATTTTTTLSASTGGVIGAAGAPPPPLTVIQPPTLNQLLTATAAPAPSEATTHDATATDTPPTTATTDPPPSAPPHSLPLSLPSTTTTTTVDPNISIDATLLNGLVPETITRAVAELFCKRAPPKMKPRPPGPLTTYFETGVSSEAGPLTARINMVAHRFSDYFRGMLVETLSDLGSANSEALIANLRLENEALRQKHTEEVMEMKKNVNSLLGDIQKSVIDEKDKIMEETKASCELETIRRVNEAKSKQWCANCLKEAQFYCCWNTSYCDYPCQAKHWLKHQYKCTQEMNQGGAQGHQQGAGSSAGPGAKAQQQQSGNVAGAGQSSAGQQQIVLRQSAPPPKGFTGKILKTTGKVLMNSRGNAKIPMNVLRRASNGSGHITIIESTPGNYELVGNGPITLGNAATAATTTAANNNNTATKTTGGGNTAGTSTIVKVKTTNTNTTSNSTSSNKQQQSLTSNLPPNSKAILLNKAQAAASSGAHTQQQAANSLVKGGSSTPGHKGVMRQQSTGITRNSTRSSTTGQMD